MLFDDAQLEVIPGSHLTSFKKNWSFVSYQKKEILTVHRGDILIFNATIHHRGINYHKTEHRRLLQVFEIFPDKTTYEEHSSQLVTVQTYNHSLIRNIVNPLLIQLSKFPRIVDVVNFIHYFLVYHHLQYKVSFMELDPWTKKDKYVSYEPAIRIDHLNYDDHNVNVCCDPTIQVLQTSNFYLYFYLLYWIVSFVLLYYVYKWWNGASKIPRKYRYKKGK